MQIDTITVKQPNFQAKISPKFEQFMRDYINNGKYRKQNNYKLNQKLNELKQFGYDNYTINLITRYKSWRNEYVLIATKDDTNSIKDSFFLLQRGTVKETIRCFLDLTKNQFNKLMKRKCIYKE